MIEKAILHLIQNDLDKPILSEKQLTLTDELITSLSKYLAKTLINDDLKLCSFNDNSRFLNLLKSNNNFIYLSKDLTKLYYDNYKSLNYSYEGNLLYIKYKIDSQNYICIIHFPFKKSLSSIVKYDNNYIEVDIVSNNNILPNSNQKINNAIIINVKDYTIKVLEHPFTLENKNVYFLSAMFLDCKSNQSNKRKLDVINKTIEKINNEYYENDLDNEITCKTIINKELLEKGQIKIEDIPKKIFKDEGIQNEFKKILDDYEIEGDILKTNTKSPLNKYNLKSIRTNNGIEIKIPLEENIINDSIQFINNVDGTISILIKNIESIK